MLSIVGPSGDDKQISNYDLLLIQYFNINLLLTFSIIIYRVYSVYLQPVVVLHC